MTCGVTLRGHGSYEVIVLPHWNLQSAVVETFHAAVDALQRHAAIAAALRSTGWSVAAYTA